MYPIQHKRPRLDYLHEYFIADMHFHTVYSDGHAKIAQLVKTLRKKDIGVAITDHNQIKGVFEAMKYKDVTIIPGIEVTSAEGLHLLFYFYSKSELKEFYEKNIRKNILITSKLRTSVPAAKLLDKGSKYNCIMVAAHPFSQQIFGGIMPYIEKGLIKKSMIGKYDAFEVLSGMCTKTMNNKAIDWIDKTQKAFTGGSDGHIMMSLGCVVTYADVQTTEDFLDVILKRKNYVVGTETRIIKRAITDVELLEKYIQAPARPKYARIFLNKIEEELHIKSKKKKQ